MHCNICLEENDELIGVLGTEGFHLNIAFVLDKHFQFCFEGKQPDGSICRKCWWKIDSFHQFYERIEELHRPILNAEEMFIDVYGNCNSEHKAIGILKNKEEFSVKSIESSCVKVYSEVDYALTSEHGNYCQTTETDLVKKSSVELKDFKIKNDNGSEENLYTNDTKPTKRKSSYSKSIAKRRAKGVKNDIAISLQCDRCGQRFMTHAKLLRHTKRDHSGFPFKCTSCIQSFIAQELLDDHVNSEHSKQPCPHCNKVIMSSYLSHHIKLIHELQFQIVCELCGKVSNTKESHNIHYKFEHMGSQKKVQCDICGQWLKHKDILRKHMLLQHIQGPQTCNICGKISPNSKALGMHKKIHSEDYKQKFKCIVCGKGFRENTKLKEHSYIHTGVTDAYQCNFCDKKFRFSSAMYAHRKKAHPNEDNYQNKKKVTT